MFGNVNYTYYSETLGRSAVPTEEDFNRYADDNRLFMKGLINDGIVTEREENGIDNAVCRMIEIDYLTGQEAAGNGGTIASESINGYSYSYDNTARQEAVRRNAKSAAQKKIDIVRLYNDYHAGVC